MSLPLPPGSYGLPNLGETLEWRRDRIGFLRRRYQRYGPIWRSATYGQREITMLGPAANAFILSTHRQHFEWGGGHETFFDRRLFGESIFLLDGEEHLHQRAFLLPALHGRPLRGYLETIRALCDASAARWAERGEIIATAEPKQRTSEAAPKLLLGADDTPRSAMTGRLVELDRQPEWVERLRAELAGAVARGPLEYEQLGGLDLLDRVIKEVERLHPPISGAPRRVVEPFDFGGHHVPAGWRVYYSVLFTHRMPEIWTEPARFDPQRFGPPP